MNKNNTEKGITLVALIITVIVLLILSVVTIQIVTGAGIIGHAKNATTQYAERALEEESAMQDYSDMLEGLKGGSSQEKGPWPQDGFTVTYGEKILKVGDKVAYSAGTGNKARIDGTESGTGTEQNLAGIALEWRVLGANEKGQLELISNKPDETNKVTLKGEAGWLNAEEVLDDVCNKMYGKGDKAASARSLKVEDIDKLAGMTTEEAKKSTDSQYGDKHEYRYSSDTGRLQYRISQDGGESWNPDWTDAVTSYETFKEPGKEEIIDKDHTDNVVRLDNNRYSYKISNKISDSTIVDLIEKGEGNSKNVSQWLSTRGVNAYTWDASFIVRQLDVNDQVYNAVLWRSYGEAIENTYAIRPVVCLASNVQIEQDANGVWQFAN